MRAITRVGLAVGLLSGLAASPAAAGDASPSTAKTGTAALGDYVVLGWNDLGMHCMNAEFSTLCILPPYNNLWAVVIKRGDPPELISSGVRLGYRFPDNTDSAGKVNFWDYDFALFGVDLSPNVGLAGKGLSGSMDWNGTAWEAPGVPVTPFEDSNPTIEDPYQLAEVTLKDLEENLLDTTTFVVPVSTEIHCDNCHRYPTNINILKKHDEENGTNLQNEKPVLCARCHASNALGTTGNPELPNLSLAIHKYHGEEIGRDMNCYQCHPGSKTQCLRGAMHLAGKWCTDCHGDMYAVGSENRDPWLDEPRCAACHPGQPEETGKLYRHSRGHGGIYCEACHNSTHAELPTAVANDSVQAMRVQGQATFIKNCTVCHTNRPTGPGPHGLMAPVINTLWMIH